MAAAEQKSYLDMSDDEVMSLPANEVETTEEVEEVVEPEADTDENQGEAEGSEEVEGEAEEDEKEEDAAEDTSEETSDENENAPDSDIDKSEEDGEKDEDAEVVQAKVDYEAEYNRLLAPFKANGKEISVKNVDDAVALMQMGANYNKKMAALKPNLKLMKLLENNGLLSEEKLSFLIDLDKKNPEAINKLVKDSGMDPLDLDAEKASAYKPQTYAVDDREIELDTVLDEIQGTPTYNRTLDIVSNKWDGASKQVIAGSPQLLKVINDHVQRGIYDTIVKEIESERMFGRLSGMSDIEAYRQVGDSIQARGGFDLVGNQGQQTQPRAPIVTPKPSKVDEDKLRDKRRAASSTKPVAPTSTARDYNPLDMSDEEFSKIGINKFL